MAPQKSVIPLLPVLFGFFIIGFCDIVGISSDYVKTAFDWSNTLTGFVPSMVFIWFLFLGVPTGILMNRIGRKNTVLFSMGITLTGMVLPLFSYNPATVLMAYALLGIGNAVLQVSLNPLLQNVVTHSSMFTSSLTAGQVVKALSSFAGPFLVLFAIRHFGAGDPRNWYYCFPILGGITLLSALWLLITPLPREPRKPVQGNILRHTFLLLKDKKILYLFLGIFFVVGVDVATNFISSKLMITRFGWLQEEAGIAPQIYFICRTAGALLGAFLMTRIAETTYFRTHILLCLAVVLGLAFCQEATWNLILIGALGFFASCIFPILYSMAVQEQPQKANLISGLMITAVAGGGAVTPAIGGATDLFHGDYTAGVFVILGCVLYLTYCAFGVKINKQNRQ